MGELTASELRIGNLIQTDYEGVMEVVNINSERLEYIDAKKPNYRAIGRFELAFVEPIPLTEEWLLKFNILRDYDGLFILSDNLKLSLGIDNAKIFYNGIYHLHTIKGFVHSLQNLYFALTNTELTIK